MTGTIHTTPSFPKRRGPLPEMARRQAATVATVERYKGKAFDWSRGITCVHLARQHLRNMGHKPPTIPRFRSALAARRALKAGGWNDVAAMLDSILPRIAPAQMTLGDVAILPGDGGLDAIVISAGPRRVFGWAEGETETRFLEPLLGKVTGAWRA